MEPLADLVAIAGLAMIWGLMAWMSGALDRLAAPKGMRP